MVRAWYFHYCGLGIVPGWGTKILQAVQCSQKKKDEISEICKSLGTWLVQYLVIVISWYFVLFVHRPTERWRSSAVFQTAKGGGSKSDLQLCFVYVFVMEHIVSTSFVHSFIRSTNIYRPLLYNKCLQTFVTLLTCIYLTLTVRVHGGMGSGSWVHWILCANLPGYWGFSYVRHTRFFFFFLQN